MANNPTAKQNNALHRESDPPPPAVVMVPLPAHGHLNQLLHLSRLISAHNIPVFYTAIATHIRQAKLRVHGWDPSCAGNLRFHAFPATHFDNPPPDPNASNKFPSHILPSLTASKNLRRPVFDFVDGLSKIFRRVVVIYDSLMAYVVQDIDSIHNADCYCFRSISAFSICSFEAADSTQLPIPPEIRREIPSLDGHYPSGFSEFLNLQSGTKKIYSGEIYNSCGEIEGLYLDFLAKFKGDGAKKMWGIGPFHTVSSIPGKTETAQNRHQCLKWLDNQGPNSVIFVSFGTTSCLSNQQIEEIAFGLERSQHKFIWVLRDADKGDIFSGKIRKAQIPNGFETRIQGRGLLVTDWAPQLEILGHQSTGGFMSHCGWNSCLESISMGVPIAAWPMHSDQPANAVLVTKVLRIGVKVMKWSRREELVTESRVEYVVRKLMGSDEGDVIRKRAAELGDAVRSSVESGAIRKEMDAFIKHIGR